MTEKVDKNYEYYVDESKPWFSKEAGWPDEVPKNMYFPKIPLGDLLRESARKWANEKVIWFLDTFVTFEELDKMVDAYATALHNLGIRKGDVVAAMLPNSIQYVVNYYACARLGAIVTGVNPTYKPMEVLHQLKTVNAKAFLFLDALYEEQIAPIIDESPVEILIATNISDLLDMSFFKKFLGKKLGKIPTGKYPSKAHEFKDMMRTRPNLPDVSVSADDVAAYLMTGGTTGVPKAAVLSHFNAVSNALQSKSWIYKVEVGAAVIGVLPLFHSFAMTTVMNISIVAGAWMMLFPRPPKTDEFIETVLRVAPDGKTMYVGAEVLFQRLAEYPGIADTGISKKLALCVSGAGPLHRPVQEAFERNTGARLVEGYGLTEASPVVSASPFWGNRVIGSIGLPFPGTEWKIFDAENFGEEKEMLPEGKTLEDIPDSEKGKYIGELCVAGPQVMQGYLNKPEETAETIKEYEGKRWLLTGDIGYMDSYGRVYLNDRKKQLIKYKGYSVFPKEVEELVGQHEAVLEVAVAGLPDKETGEKIKAWVVLRDEWKGKITEEELRAWCKENMTHYKVPAYIEFIDELPKNLIGKVQRRQLQENDPIYKEYYGIK